MDDKNAKGRGVYLRGQDNGYSKLTDENVRTIRSEFAKGVQQATLARHFRVTPQLIHQIVRLKVWKHIGVSNVDGQRENSDSICIRAIFPI